MARSTVIDSLLVVLGLDATPYKKGEADAEKSQKRLRDQTKKASDEMSGAIKGVARQVGLLVLGFESVKGALSFLTDLNNADAALGRLALNTGTSVHELNKWGLAVNLAGGDAKEAQGDIANLSNSLTARKATGDVSPLLLLLQRAGVATEDATGKTRNLFDMYQDLGAYLRQFNRADAFNLGRGAGVSEGTLNLLLQEDAARKAIFAKAEAQNNLDEAAAKRAQEMQRQWRELVQGAENFGRVLLDAVFPAVMSFFKALEPVKPLIVDIVNSLKDAGAFEGLARGITHAAEALKLAIDGWKELIALLPKGGEKIANVIDAVNAPRGSSDEGVLTRLKNVFSSPEETTERRNVANIRKTEGVAAAARYYQEQERIKTAKATGYGVGQGAATTVHIDQINVHTQATDAQGIAAELPGALRRKGVVTQADTGMN